MTHFCWADHTRPGAKPPQPRCWKGPVSLGPTGQGDCDLEFQYPRESLEYAPKVLCRQHAGLFHQDEESMGMPSPLLLAVIIVDLLHSSCEAVEPSRVALSFESRQGWYGQVHKLPTAHFSL